MVISAETIKTLREMTSCGVIECKKALEEAKGNFDQAKEILRKRGLEIAAKKAGRAAKEGRVEVYIHPGSKLGVLVEINSETDFVARSEEFCAFSKNVALHIAACQPAYIRKEEIPAELLKAQPDQETFAKEKCLLLQPFVKDPAKTIQDCLNELVAKVGENIAINRFVRYKVGESEQKTNL